MGTQSTFRLVYIPSFSPAKSLIQKSNVINSLQISRYHDDIYFPKPSTRQLTCFIDRVHLDFIMAFPLFSQ